jgi:hypothetical protein
MENEMKELMELLQTLKSEGAPDKVIQEIEQIIERRALRIKRHEDDIRRWIAEREQQQKKDKKSFDFLLLLFLLLLLDSDKPDDEFCIHDLWNPDRHAGGRQAGNDLSSPDWDEVKKTDKPKM